MDCKSAHSTKHRLWRNPPCLRARIVSWTSGIDCLRRRVALNKTRPAALIPDKFRPLSLGKGFRQLLILFNSKQFDSFYDPTRQAFRGRVELADIRGNISHDLLSNSPHANKGAGRFELSSIICDRMETKSQLTVFSVSGMLLIEFPGNEADNRLSAANSWRIC